MKLGWCHELSQVIFIDKNGAYDPETSEVIDDITETDLSEVIEVNEPVDFYLHTPDSGYIILHCNPMRIIYSNLAEIAMYPISGVYPLNNTYSKEMFNQLDELANKEMSLENDPVLAAALNMTYVEYHIKTYPPW